jgi:hypothetical protein
VATKAAKKQYGQTRSSLLFQIQNARVSYSDTAQQLVDAVTTIEEAQQVFHLTPKGTAARWNCYKKWVELANSLEELEAVCAVSDKRGDWPRGSKKYPGDAGKDKWVKLTSELFEIASTKEELVDLFDRTPHFCSKYDAPNYQPAEFSAKIMEKIISSCSTREEIEQLVKDLWDKFGFKVLEAGNKKIEILGSEPVTVPRKFNY